jgi:hypothetical protein
LLYVAPGRSLSERPDLTPKACRMSCWVSLA